MDSVTESKLAAAMAQQGGLGILHRNCSPTDQVRMAQQVKASQVDVDAFPNATLDGSGRLAIGAAVGPQDVPRVKALAKVVDLLIVDVAHFHTRSCFEGACRILKESPIDVVVGNVGTFEAAEDVLTRLERIAGLRCGIGSGSTCVTSVQTRVSAPTLFAVASAADAAAAVGAKIPIIADGGIRNPGDAALALAAGASSVMLGNVLAATEESPTPIQHHNGLSYKGHWGMGSQKARERRFALDRYSKPSKGLAEGIEGLVRLRGTVAQIITEFTSGLKASCGYVGAASIADLWERARFGRVSIAGEQELQPHSLLDISQPESRRGSAKPSKR
jgi:IMP dehydrogenase